METVQVGRYPLAYIRSSNGSKGSLIFVHGAGGSHKTWRYQTPENFPGFTSLYLDLPAHGESGGEPPTTIEDFTAAVLGLATTLELPAPWIIVGHSMGGAIALQSGLQHCPALGGLVLISTGARLKKNAQFMETLRRGEFDKNNWRMGYGRLRSPEWVTEQVNMVEDIPVNIIYCDYTAVDQFDVTSRLTEIKVPTLVMAGSDDLLTPVFYSHQLQRAIPGAELVEIAGGGHNIIHEVPEKVNEGINRFLAKIFP